MIIAAIVDFLSKVLATTEVDIIQIQRRASAHGGAQCVTCTGGAGFHGPYAEQRCLPIHAE